MKLLAHEVFERFAGKIPDATAIVHGTVSLSYGQLNASANRLARRLRAAGARPETVVGVRLDRTPEFVVAELAILKTGAAFLPLDTEYPAARLDGMVRDSGAIMVVHRGSPPGGARGLDLGTINADEAAYGDGNLAVTVPDAALAYVIYTSGSTGSPKGVQVEHAQFTAMLDVLPDLLMLGERSRTLQSTSFAFDMSVGLTFAVLASGGALILADSADAARPDRLVQLIEEQRADTVALPPSVLAVLPQAQLAGLRTVCAGGEACSVSVYRRYGAGRRFINVYGPTETTVVATAHVSDGPRVMPDEVPIGRPLPCARVYVLDEAGRPVPRGRTGEIYIGGTGVSRGYLGRPGATADRFLPDPFAGALGARMYRTGDFGQFMPDGELQFRGRTDHQVKINGYRIELGDIERALETHPQVRQAVVVVKENPAGSPRLNGFVMLRDWSAGAELRGYLAGRLPHYLLPSVILPVAAFPLTPNGKIDRSVLAGFEIATGSRAVTYSPPQTRSETVIAEAWAQALGMPRVGRHDAFFELGGDSLAAGRLIGRLRRLLGVELPLRAFFDAGMTVESLAAAVDTGTFAAASAPVSRIPRRSHPQADTRKEKFS